jgi:hypothetical protein
MASIANFYKYYCIGVKHDQIELAKAASPVLRQKAQSLAFKMLPGKCLSSFSTFLGACAGYQFRRSGSG